MHSNKRFTLPAVMLAMLLTATGIFASTALSTNLPDPAFKVAIGDDDQPDVTARVARISFINGEVQVRRLNSQDWEKATLNLPIVEGDELSTSAGSRIELQFDSYTHVRVDQNSYLKVTKLKDEGIALSVPQGTFSFRLSSFDHDKSYFEVDAPGSTIAVQRAGMYRIDAGQTGEAAIRVSVNDNGEARIYSETSGFTLKSGKSARVFISGANSGEFETAKVEQYADEFDSWALERDATIAKSLQTADYDKYYDRDIYGAEDLNNYGEWVYTAKYGYVWRPYRSTTSVYAGWTPYRYGHWRWVPPYGWTWINDEPWGWATYHHGRWFYDDGYWNWTPYGAYRYSRSWWSPALVYVSIFGGNICWYPLPYGYGYYNYNHYYNTYGGWGGNGGGNGHHNGGGNGGNGNGGPTPTPTPNPNVGINGPGVTKGPKTPPLGSVPPTGVVTVPTTEFGRMTKGNRTAPLSVANSVLSRTPTTRETSPVLPTYSDVRGRGGRDITTDRPANVSVGSTARTGATDRRNDAPLDNQLRTTRIFGGRPPLATPTPTSTTDTTGPTTRRTGAVERPPTVDTGSNTVRQPGRTVNDDTRRAPESRPTYTPPTTRSDPPSSDRQRPTPRYEPPTNRSEPPVNRQPPVRNDPPPTNRQPPPPRNDPPPTRSEPKTDKKPPVESRPAERKKDDGRK